MRQHCGDKVPIVLVGTKLDLREDDVTTLELAKEGKIPVTYTDGLKLQRKIEAVKYMECSAKTLTNVHEVFQEALRAAIAVKEPKPKKSACCTLL